PGNQVTVNSSVPGQRAIYTFGGTAGQRANVNVTNWTVTACPWISNTGVVSILNPDGSTLASAGLCNGAAFVDAVTLPSTGTYKLVFDAAGTYTGTANLTLYVFADVTGSVTSNNPITVSIQYPDQRA